MLLDVVLVALTGDDLDQQAERCVVPVGVLKRSSGIVCELDVLGLGNPSRSNASSPVSVREHVVHARRCRGYYLVQ